MSKYTQDELRRWAQIALVARDSNDERYLALVLTLSMRTGLSPEEVEKRIKRLAA